MLNEYAIKQDLMKCLNESADLGRDKILKLFNDFILRRNGTHDGSQSMTSGDFITALFDAGFKSVKSSEFEESDSEESVCFKGNKKYVCLSINFENGTFAQSKTEIWNSNANYVGLDNTKESLNAESAFKDYFGKFFEFTQDKNGIFTITKSKEFGNDRIKTSIEFDRVVRKNFVYADKLSKKHSVPVIIYGNGTSYLFIDAEKMAWRTAGDDAFIMGANGW